MDEYLTLTETQTRLNTTTRKLQTALRHPAIAPHVTKRERMTRTGMRTATMVPVSVLPALAELLAGNTNTSEPKRPASAVSGEVEFLRAQLVERDAQVRALLRIVDEDREELRRLRAQTALPAHEDARTATQEETPVKDRRGVWGRVLDALLFRN